MGLECWRHPELVRRGGRAKDLGFENEIEIHFQYYKFKPHARTGQENPSRYNRNRWKLSTSA
jgi:hypothetical protein